MSNNRTKVVSISSPGGKKTVKWIKKSRNVRKCSVKRAFLKILQNSQENTCAGDFLKKSYRFQACINLLEQFPHIQKANFAILFLSENIKTQNGSFCKIETATGGVP